jgi:hypothetical protein
MLGKIVLAGALSHSWLLVAAVLAITAITYIATIVLVTILKNGDKETEFEVKALLISVKKRRPVDAKPSTQSRRPVQLKLPRR